MKQMAESLQSAQQSLQQAGQKSASGQQGEQEASDAEMGKEFQPGRQGSGQQGQQGQQGQASGNKGGGQGQSKQGGSSGQGSQASSSGNGGALGGPGRGAGGSVGPQQPLPGVKRDVLWRGTDNPNGKRNTKSYMGTPDPTQDKAAYYSVVPERVKAAEASLNREEIPTGHKKQVRDYFDSIQPH